MKEARDIEAQSSPPPIAAENHVSTKSKFIFLAAYFLLNLFLTLSNKSVLSIVSLPPTLTSSRG
jgi:hypothetical protein